MNSPFRYKPSEDMIKEAAQIIKEIDSFDPQLQSAFAQGKMIGILIASDKEGKKVILKAFSGNVGGLNRIEGFVPPLIDLLDPEGYFKKRESEISAMNRMIEQLERSEELSESKHRLAEIIAQRESDISLMREKMRESKMKRERIRASLTEERSDSRYDREEVKGILESLEQESRFEKGELARMKRAYREREESTTGVISEIEGKIDIARKERSRASEELQRWISESCSVHNFDNETLSIMEIFRVQGLIPPGGTGECAAPKLLEYAALNGLHPLEMGEFWYGQSPSTAVRNHGHFYPSCTSKCGPLLKFMMRGLSVQEPPISIPEPMIIYLDRDIVVVVKPSGIPSVKGTDGRISLEEWLRINTKGEIFPVHRLDMDTSGIMIYARNPESEVFLKREFEEHIVRKEYRARLLPWNKIPEKGTVELPLSPDYDERPRQMVNSNNGKGAVTRYTVTGIDKDGLIEVSFFPHTGRTHQLRVHAAHKSGLGCPIAGDMLYGAGAFGERLCLHAYAIAFIHPRSAEPLSFATTKYSF